MWVKEYHKVTLILVDVFGFYSQVAELVDAIITLPKTCSIEVAVSLDWLNLGVKTAVQVRFLS